MARTWVVGVLAVLVPDSALAHSFGVLYTLPLPIWMYLYGASAALVVSFLVISYFVTVEGAVTSYRTRPLPGWLAAPIESRALRHTARVGSVGCLLLAIVAGFVGTANPYANINMTLFWIVFALGLTYVTALIGNVYAVLNPWRALVEWTERLWPAAFRGRFRVPAWLGCYPALAFYAGFIWIELFARTRPFGLSVWLSICTLCNFAGAWAAGKDRWFRDCEFFAVLLRLVSLMAPVDSSSGLRLRPPFTGLVERDARDLSTLLFVLFMLSSTAYDGVRETTTWTAIFWKGIAPWFTPWVGSDIVQSFPMLRVIHRVFQYAMLLLSPFAYLAVYLLFIALARRITGSTAPIVLVAQQFAFSLLPIAFVYNLAHYYTLIETQGVQIVRLISDPLGRDWNLFGTASWLARPLIPDAGTVWHTQVWLILAGHIVSVYIAHRRALRIFSTQRQAMLSQLPMLLLMVVFTTIGLWILAQPIQSGQVMQTGASG